MTDGNDMYDINNRELNDVVLPDADETKEQQRSFSFHDGKDLDDIPPSLLSYFETSKSRAAVCEKFILEKHEDFTASHHAEDMMTLPIELDKDMMDLPTELDVDMMKLNEQIICHRENEENNTSTDTRPLPAPTETEARFTHNVSVYPNNEDEAGTDDYMESEKRLAFQEGTTEISLNEEEINKSSDYKAEQDEVRCEEMKKEGQKRHRERKFQEELEKIMEAEKVHQKELELMKKTAQEKLEQEFLVQQELITNLQRRVEEERRKTEEEQKRMKDEKDKLQWEEEKNKIEAERKRMEEETRRKKREEERKMEEVRHKKEEERKNMEEKKRIMEREEKRKREEERSKIDLEKKKLEDEMRMMKEEEKRKTKEEVERTKKKEKEERTKLEEMEVENERKRKTEKQMSLKEEEWQKKEEVRKNREQKNMRTEEEIRITKATKEKKKQEEMKKKKEEEADERKTMAQEKMYEEMSTSNNKQHGYVDREIKHEDRKKTEESDEKEEGDDEKTTARKREKERKKTEEKKEVREVVRKQEGEDSNIEEELRPTEEDEKRKREEEWKTKDEEHKRRQKEEMMRQGGQERKSEDIGLGKEGNKGCDVDYRTMEKDNKTKIKEKKQEEEEKGKRMERKNAEAEKEQNGEEMKKNKKTEEETPLKENVKSKKRTPAQEKEVRTNEVQDIKEKECMVGQNEKNNFDSSQLKDSHTRTSSSPDHLHSVSTMCYTSTEARPQQHDLDRNVNQTSAEKNQAVTSSTASVLLPVCLPEHTEQKRLSWMNDCVSWTKLSLQNRRKQKGSVQSHRGPRRAADASSLPPLCPDFLLRSTGWKSLQQVTTLTLEDLPGCSLSTLAHCTQLQSLSLRCCGLKSLEGLHHLPQLCYIDVQENDISFIDCENMTSLQVLQLSHNKLTSIHGLSGAENLNVLDLSHNFITRIAGLESVRSLQRLSVDHNQLISTKGLKDVYTLLHLNCSHNHLASVEGLENSALLNTLDLRANSLTEPPSLNNHVLLRELRLDNNSISSLQGLTACWLPLMQHFSVAQNRITQLPSMSDCVSLANLDLRFNCMSELQNVCVSLEGCHFLQEVHLAGNPLQQEKAWRSTLQKAVPSLRFIDGQQTDSFLSPPTVQPVSLASGNFLMFCQAQLQQTHDLQQELSRMLSAASSPLDAVKTSCRHYTEALQLATDQRFAHEYGNTTVADKHSAVGQTIPEETLNMDRANAEEHAERPEMESTVKVPPVISNRDDIRCSDRTIDENSTAESQHDTFYTAATGPRTVPTVWKANSCSAHSMDTKRKTVSNHQNLDLQNTAAVVIQHLWKKYREKCGNISSPSTSEKGGGKGGGDGGKPESGPSYINGSVVGQDYAATVIQAFWRGFSLRKRLTSALAAVTCPDTGEDDTFEEVDVDEFVFDEETLEKHWTLLLSEDLPTRCYPVSEQLLSVKPPGTFPDPSQYIVPPPLVQSSRQAWVDEELVDSAGHKVSPPSSNRSKSPASVISGLSGRSEKILEEWGFTHQHTALLMLKRAQNMKSKKQQRKKCRDPSVRLAWFKNQPGPVQARNRQAQNNRNDIKASTQPSSHHTLFQTPSSNQTEIQPHQTSVLMSEGHKAREAKLGLQQTEKTEHVRRERAQQWLHTQTAHSDRDSESEHFLPEISSDILNGGRVQLVADPGYTDRLHHANGLWANSSSAAQPCKQNNYLRKNCLGHTREEVPSLKRVTSAPSKKERISFRDNPVQMSDGWGGGKKRDKVHK